VKIRRGRLPAAGGSLALLAALALPLAVAGCARGGLSPKLAADPEALLAEVRSAQSRVERVRGTARVRVESPGLNGTITELVAAEKPARLRLETLDFFGNPAALLVADGERFGFYDARSRTWYRGDATPENVSRFLPVALPPGELVTVLCGSAPILPGKAIEATPKDGRVYLVVAAGEIGQRLAIGQALAIESSRVRRAAADPGMQAAFYDLEFESFDYPGGVRFPTETRLDAPSARSRLQLSWRDDLEVNGTSDPRLFSLEPPRGAKVVELPPGGAAPEVELPIQPE
jgi:outer membrane lipoprotein-sorting protein